MAAVAIHPALNPMIAIVRVAGPTGAIHFANQAQFERAAEDGCATVTTCTTRVAGASLSLSDVTCRWCVANKHRYDALDVTNQLIAEACL